MRFPAIDAILELHRDILERTGGTPGILNLGAIDSALYRAKWGPFQGVPGLADRAALLLRGICQDHPFVDGNKRTAFEATDLFLAMNGAAIRADGDTIIAAMLAIAQDQMDLPAIVQWLQANLGKP
jgi:death-on-curing protein